MQDTISAHAGQLPCGVFDLSSGCLGVVCLGIIDAFVAGSFVNDAVDDVIRGAVGEVSLVMVIRIHGGRLDKV